MLAVRRALRVEVQSPNGTFRAYCRQTAPYSWGGIPVIRQGLIVTNSVRVGKRTLRRLPDGPYHYPEIWGHSRGSMSALEIWHSLNRS
jgi:hypothetical protein